MNIHLSRSYLCNSCTTEINKEEDGIVVFGSLCVVGERGLKARVGEVPDDQNVKALGSIVTPICKTCLVKKLKAVSSLLPTS